MSTLVIKVTGSDLVLDAVQQMLANDPKVTLVSRDYWPGYLLPLVSVERVEES